MYWHELIDSQLADLLGLERLGLISDFDGTLSPIVPTMDGATLPDNTRETLSKLADQLRLVALVSGRGAADLYGRVGLDSLVYIGNHGLERRTEEGIKLSPQAAAYRPKIQAFLDGLSLPPEIELEDKGPTLAFHYRRAADPAAIQAEYAPRLAALAAQHDLKFSEGRMIFEIKPPLNINKGTALSQLVSDYRLDGLIFIGDDTTDADAMQAAHELRERGRCEALCIGVESDEMPPRLRQFSDVYASDTADVGKFLVWLSANIA